jgi:hypothetical protein
MSVSVHGPAVLRLTPPFCSVEGFDRSDRAAEGGEMSGDAAAGSLPCARRGGRWCCNSARPVLTDESDTPRDRRGAERKGGFSSVSAVTGLLWGSVPRLFWERAVALWNALACGACCGDGGWVT